MVANASAHLRRERYPFSSSTRCNAGWARLAAIGAANISKLCLIWLAFGKKAQVCGVMGGPRLDEVKDNAFRLSSRLNSTWGGEFHRYGALDLLSAESSEKEHLVENAGKVGAYFLDQLRDLQREKPMISAARGRGLFLAFRFFRIPRCVKNFGKLIRSRRFLTLRSGENSIRFRPALDTTAEVIDEAMELMRKQCQRMLR